MVLDEISVFDFGVYSGKHTISLTPEKDKPIVLFGGLNGAGKTTLLDALQLCLFGAAAQCAGRANSSYQDYLLRAINKNSQWGQASISLVFRCFMEGKKERYRVTRTWKERHGSVKESLDVTINRKPAHAVAKNWNEHINHIIPANIAHLFFFDGEKVALYASPEMAQSLVATAVHNLLGIDIVEQTKKDLQTLERKKKSEKMPQEDKVAVEQKQKEQADLERQSVRLAEKAAEIQSRRLDKYQRDLEKAEKAYHEQGGNLLDRNERIHRRLMRVERLLAVVKGRLVSIADSRLPLLLVHSLLQRALQLSQEDKKVAQERLLVDVLEKRDDDILNALPKTREAQGVIGALKDYSRRDIARRRKVATADACINADEHTMLVMRDFLSTESQHLKNETARLAEHYGRLADQLDVVKLEKASIPPADTLDDAKKECHRLQNEVWSAEREIKALRHEREELGLRISKLESEIQMLEEKNFEAVRARKDMRRFITHSENARQILDKFKEKVIHWHIQRIEKLVLERLQMLLRKKSLVSGLKINEKNFEITLRDMEQRPLSQDQLSKGEQQLLAVALLWGLARASNKALPVAIDTPLGRLDSLHREQLIERYFGYASHQVLLFSTDEEIVGEYLKKLKRRISKNYLLCHDDVTSSTLIKKEWMEK